MCAATLLFSCSGSIDSAFSEVAQENVNFEYNLIDQYNIPDDQIAEYVVTVFEDSKENLWLGTMAKGAVRVQRSPEGTPKGASQATLTYFTTDDGLNGNTISSFAEDREGRIWMGGHHGLSVYDGNEFTSMWKTSGQHDQGDGWMGVQTDKEGRIWVHNRNGVFNYDGESFIEFDLPIDPSKSKTYAISPGSASLDLIDSKGNMWFSADGDGSYRWDGQTYTHFTKAKGLCSNTVNDIVEDDQGRIWFICMQAYQPTATGDGGLCRYDPNSQTDELTIEQFPHQKGLTKNDLYTIYKDRKGALWISAIGAGVYRFENEVFTLIDETDRMDLTRGFGLQDALEDRRGNMWFGFSGGLFRWKDGKIINVTQNGPWD